MTTDEQPEWKVKTSIATLLLRKRTRFHHKKTQDCKCMKDLPDNKKFAVALKNRRVFDEHNRPTFIHLSQTTIWFIELGLRKKQVFEKNLTHLEFYDFF